MLSLAMPQLLRSNTKMASPHKQDDSHPRDAGPQPRILTARDLCIGAWRALNGKRMLESLSRPKQLKKYRTWEFAVFSHLPIACIHICLDQCPHIRSSSAGAAAALSKAISDLLHIGACSDCAISCFRLRLSNRGKKYRYFDMLWFRYRYVPVFRLQIQTRS